MLIKMDWIEHNRRFWNEQSRKKGPWSRPVSKALIEKAKKSPAKIPYFPEAMLPESWEGLDVLGLACAGGQQMPLIAAMGAHAASYDFSEEQLKKDREAARQASLKIKTILGDMESLEEMIPKNSFDFILNGVSVCYTKNALKVWRGAYQALRPKGTLAAAFVNPVYYSLEPAAGPQKNGMRLVHKIPCEAPGADSPSGGKRQPLEAAEFSHSLEALIGGQAEAGFKITGLWERRWRDLGEEFERPVDSIMPSFIFTKAVK